MTEPKSPKTPSKAVTEQILDTYQFMCEEGLETLEIEEKSKSFRFKIRRQTDREHLPAARSAAREGKRGKTAPEALAESAATVIVSPLVGIFYRSPSPASEAFVQEGKVVEKNTIVCIVEAMKVMNEIRNDRRCKIVRILVENGKQVVPQEALFEVEYL